MAKLLFLFLMMFCVYLPACNLFAAEQADIIIVHGHILTIDPKMTEFQDGAVAIKDKKIVMVGSSKEVLAKFQATRVIDAASGIVMPGMVNAHTHVPMVAFRSLGEEGVKDRLFKYFFPLEAKLVKPGLVYTATLHGVIEMAMGGVTTYSDMYYFEDSVAKATEKIGIRGVLGETVIGFPVPDAKEPYGGLGYAEKFIKEFKGHELITPAVAAHATFTLSPEKLRECRALAEKYDVPLLLHVAEFANEAERVETKFGSNPDKLTIIQYLEKEGILYNKLCAAHVIHVNDDDIALLKKYDVSVSVNTIANSKGATGTSPVAEMMEAGVRVGLGTDGPMSSNTLDMIDAMDSVARINKLVNEDNTLMIPKEVVHLATMGGAQALGMADKIGSLEAGKYADITIVAHNAPNMIPDYDSYATLVFAASPRNVSTVLCNGKVIVENGKLVTYDYSQDVRDMEKLSKEVWNVAKDL